MNAPLADEPAVQVFREHRAARFPLWVPEREGSVLEVVSTLGHEVWRWDVGASVCLRIGRAKEPQQILIESGCLVWIFEDGGVQDDFLVYVTIVLHCKRFLQRSIVSFFGFRGPLRRNIDHVVLPRLHRSVGDGHLKLMRPRGIYDLACNGLQLLHRRWGGVPLAGSRLALLPL